MLHWLSRQNDWVTSILALALIVVLAAMFVWLLPALFPPKPLVDTLT